MSTTKKIISFTIVLILAFIENCLGELRVIGEPVQDGVEAKSFCSLNALSGTMDYIGLRTDASSCLIVDDTQVAKLVICDLLGKVSAEIVLETELAQPILVPVSNLGAIGRGGLEHESTDVALNNLASEGLGKASFTGSTLELGLLELQLALHGSFRGVLWIRLLPMTFRCSAFSFSTIRGLCSS